MKEIQNLGPIDYLMIGHLTVDETPEGLRLDGAAAYSALTAHAMGLRVGMVTSWAGEIPLDALEGIPVVNFPTEKSTTFENIYTEQGRIQTIKSVAPKLDYYQVPDPWRSASIVHLGPVAQEVEPSLVREFPSSLICVTPQGWLRTWDQNGLVSPAEWPEASFVLSRSGAAVISHSDIGYDDERLDEMVVAGPVVAVTEGADGVSLYWNGDVRRFRPPPVVEVDPTGAGDIFAASLFVRLFTTRDPWEAARFATQVAAISVTRPGLAGIPTRNEINSCMVEVL